MAQAAANTEISLEQVTVLLYPEAGKILKALASGEKTFGELENQVGPLTTYYLARLEAIELVVRGPYTIIQTPSKGNLGKASQTYKFNPDVLSRIVVKLEELASFYNRFPEETREQHLM